MTNSASGATLPFRSSEVGNSGKQLTSNQQPNMSKSKNTKSNLQIAPTRGQLTGASTPTIISSDPRDSD